MTELIVAMLAGNCENTIDMALESVKDADKIIIIYDTTSKDKTNEKIQNQIKLNPNKIVIYTRPYAHSPENKYSNSEARNFYLDILKKNTIVIGVS